MTIYRPRSSEQDQIASALGAADYKRLHIDPETRGDQKVTVTVERQPINCTDTFTIEKRENGTILLNRDYCGLTGQGMPRQEDVKKGTKRWLPLQALFIPDADVKRPLPESWKIATKILGDPQSHNSLMMWQSANPRLDPLREYWALSTDPEANLTDVDETLLQAKRPPSGERKEWKQFALFLHTYFPRLREGFKSFGLRDEDEKRKQVRLAKTYFVALLDMPKGGYDVAKLNVGLNIAFGGKIEDEVYQNVRLLFGSEFPFAPTKEIDKMAKAATAWVLRRYVMLILAEDHIGKKAKIKRDPPKPQVTTLQSRLKEAFENPEVSLRDIEDIRATYRKDLWTAQFKKPSTRLVYPDEWNDFKEKANDRFDKKIAFPVLKNLVKNEKNLTGDQKERVPQRLSEILGLSEYKKTGVVQKLKGIKKGTVGLQWNRFVAPTYVDFSVVADAQRDDAPARKAAIRTATKQFQKQEPGEGRFHYFLSMTAAYKIIDRLETLRAGGVSTQPGSDRPEDRVKLTNESARDILEAILKKTESEYFGIEPMARQALSLAILVHFAPGAEPAAVAIAGAKAAAPKPPPPKAPPKPKVKTAREVSLPPIEGVDWRSERDNGIHQYRQSGNFWEPALLRLKQAAAAQAGSPDWAKGEGWERSRDWKTLYWIAKIAYDKNLLEITGAAGTRAVEIAISESEKKKTEAFLEEIEKNYARVTFLPDPNREGVQSGFVMIKPTSPLINPKKKELAGEVRARLLTTSITLPYTIYLPFADFEANNVGFTIQKGEVATVFVELYPRSMVDEGFALEELVPAANPFGEGHLGFEEGEEPEAAAQDSGTREEMETAKNK